MTDPHHAAAHPVGDNTGSIPTQIPDLSNMTIAEIRDSNDPAIIAATQRIIDGIINRQSEPGC